MGQIRKPRRTQPGTRKHARQTARRDAGRASHDVNIANYELRQAARGRPHDDATVKKAERRRDNAEAAYGNRRVLKARATGRKDKVGAKRARRAEGALGRARRDATAAATGSAATTWLGAGWGF